MRSTSEKNKSRVNCLRRWQLCRSFGKMRREDAMSSGPWRSRFTRRFLVNQEKERPLYQRSCVHEDAEDMTQVQIWISPLTSRVKSFSLCWSLGILICKRQIYYFRATHTFMLRLDSPCFWNQFENDEAGNGYEIGWMVVPTGALEEGGDGTLLVTTVKVRGWEDHSR